MKKSLLSLGLLLLCGMLSAQTLTLEVKGIQQVSGNLMIAVFDSPESFLQKPCFVKKVAVNDSILCVVCEGLPYGRYALTLFHDANLNNSLDLAESGIPMERYAFSNNPKLYGKPEFAHCAFDFTSNLTLTLQLK
ncbi:MAG: DUF2141 domain-containing protein [Bacteroidales bacterium]|nr:DUF2141 domain-containing protein [Bacteroidales bacterium]MDD4770731.1 DUF2141 domain-containing protein [Bacteroidales bacterium]